MKNKIIYMVLIIFIAAPAIIWAAQRTVTTYTWDRDIGIEASGGGGGSTININDDIEDFTPGASTPNSVDIDVDKKLFIWETTKQIPAAFYGTEVIMLIHVKMVRNNRVDAQPRDAISILVSAPILISVS